VTSIDKDPQELFAIGLCGPQEREEQASLFNACFKKSLDAEALRWRYDQNPHGAAVSLLARPGSDAGVCGYACSPRLALCRGEHKSLAPIGQTGDVMTHPDWRKRGIFSQLDRRCMEETARLGWPIVFGLPNRRSAHIFLKLGWEQIGKIRPWTFVIRATSVARAKRRVDGRWRAFRIRADQRKGAKARTRLRGITEGLFGVRRISRFDDQVEQLSKAVEAGFDFMVRRDAAYLNWRFIDNTARLHTSLGIYRTDGELAAYVIVQSPREGEVVGYLVDVLAKDEAALAQALEAGLAHLEAAGAELVQSTAIDGSWWSAKLAGAGFQPPRKENHLIVILYTHDAYHPLARAARDASCWYLTDGDRDDETMG
jgi:GNAT superfamily N-acetyltransferase